MIRELCPKNKTKLVNTDSEFQRIIIIFAGQKTFRVCVPYSCSKIVSPENYIETVVQSVKVHWLCETQHSQFGDGISVFVTCSRHNCLWRNGMRFTFLCRSSALLKWYCTSWNEGLCPISVHPGSGETLKIVI
jgi:hypothetical protein